MATFCKNHNFIYFASPGTASTSIEHLLLQQLPARYINGDETLFKYGTRHAQFPELKKLKERKLLLENNILNEIDLDNIVKITSIRNPFAYFYADWYRNRNKWLKELENPDSWVYQQPNKIKQIVKACTLEFSDWLIDQNQNVINNNIIRHLNHDYTNHADLFIRMENLDEDLDLMSKKLKLNKPLEKLTLNKTEVGNDRGEYWQFYSKKARDLVEKYYRPTLLKFDYRF